MKFFAISFLVLFSVLPLWAEDLSCPQEEPSKAEALLEGITNRLKAGTLSKDYCKEYAACMIGTEDAIDADCSTKIALDMYSGDSESGNCNLSLQERHALEEYMGSLYGCLNRSLYSKKGASFPTLKGSLNSSLRRFPAYEGFVFRGSDLPKAVLDAHQVGQTVTYPAYTSTSTNLDIANNFGTHKFLIHSKSGRPIMGIQGGEGEYEVLFTAGTRFRVLAVKNEKYIMREVSGKETESQAKAEDARILKLALEAKNKFDPASRGTPDTWSCPLNDKLIPKRLVQKTIPDLREFVE